MQRLLMQIEAGLNTKKPICEIDFEQLKDEKILHDEPSLHHLYKAAKELHSVFVLTNVIRLFLSLAVFYFIRECLFISD